MSKFFRLILHWIGTFLRAIASVFEEEAENDRQEKPRLEAEAGKSAIKPGELVMGSGEKPEYRKSKSVLSYSESVLHKAIDAATNGEFAILMKVRMGDFVWLRNEPNDRKFFNNQILCKHVDFLLCNKDTLAPLLVIELDDSSHKNAGSPERDKFKDETFAAIGMPCLRIKVEGNYDIAMLSIRIHEKIGVGAG